MYQPYLLSLKTAAKMTPLNDSDPHNIESSQTESLNPENSTPEREYSVPSSSPVLSNQALCWPIDHWRLPTKIVVVVQLHQPPVELAGLFSGPPSGPPAGNLADEPTAERTSRPLASPPLTAVIPAETWQQLQQQSLPWIVYFPPQHLILLRP